MHPEAEVDLTGLRILAFCDHFTEDTSGGAEKVSIEVYRRLIQRGADVRVVSAIAGATEGEGEVAGIPTRVVRGKSLAGVFGAQVLASRRLGRIARRMVGEWTPDVIHASSIHFQGSITAARLARRHKIPLVTTAHVGSVSALPLLTRIATSIYENTFGRFVLRSSARVIAVSRATAAHVRRLGARNVTVVANGVDHDRFAPPPQRPESPIEIVFVGRLIGNKGPAMALAAFSSLHHPTARLTFVGDGPNRRNLERAGAKIGDTVRFLGHRGDVAEVLKAAHIVVRPSQTEGQSLAMLEAMASGVVVVASDIEANRELIQTGETGLLHRINNVIDLADALREAITNPVLRQNLAAAAHQHALRYSWDQCATETGAVLLAAANEKGGR